MNQDKSAKTYTMTGAYPSMVQLNQVLQDIGRRLSSVEGIGQNLDAHGAQITNMSGGSRAREGLTTNSIGNTPVFLNGKILDLKIQPDSGLAVDDQARIYIMLKSGFGIECDAAGLKLIQQVATAVVADAVNVTAFSTIAGTDQINLADLNTKLGTLTTQINAAITAINALATAVNDIITKAVNAQWMA